MTDQANTYWFLRPRDFQNEYNVGVATSAADAEQYEAEGYERIDREAALRYMSRRVASHEQLFARIEVDGEQVMDRFNVARALRRGAFRPDWPY